MKHFILEKKENIAILKINRPKVLNALNKEVLNELLAFLESTGTEKQIDALILTGEGPKAFIAGADIGEMKNMSPLEMLDFCDLGQRVSLLLENASFLTIAAVNGYALGGGLEMALACDFIYASSTAKLGLPEVTLGIIPGFGGTQRLSRAIGTRLAKEYIMSGKTLSAQEAKEIGVVNKVCEPSQLLEDCQNISKDILRNSLIAIKMAKAAVTRGNEIPILEALELEKHMCAVCFGTQERADKMQAFLNKKKENEHAVR